MFGNGTVQNGGAVLCKGNAKPNIEQQRYSRAEYRTAKAKHREALKRKGGAVFCSERQWMGTE